MDVVLDFFDRLCLDSAYASPWTPAPLRGLSRENIFRQLLSLWSLIMVGIHLMYFIIAGASYMLLFDKRMMKHPRFLKHQIRQEMRMSLVGFPQLTALTVPWFLGEVRGHSRLYDNIADAPFCNGNVKLGVAFTIFMCGFFLWFTDFCIYWIHRIEHWPSIYKHIHKPHHKWVIPTPFASHAFHPLDGYAQSLPYHFFVYLFPLHRYTYMGLFVFVNLWTIAIHDSDMIVGHPLESIINGPAHHTLHHMYFVYNYGQYFTWCDKLGQSYRHPKAEDDPLLTVLAKDEAKLKYAEEKRELLRQEEQERKRQLTQRIAHSSIRESIPQAMLDATPSSSPLLPSTSSQTTSGRRTPELYHSSMSTTLASGNTSDEDSSAESEINTPREEVANLFARQPKNSKPQRWSSSLRLGLSLTSAGARRRQ